MNIEKKLRSLEEQIDIYKNLSDIDKLKKSDEVNQLIRECTQELDTFNTIIEELNEKADIEKIDQTEFTQLIEEINISEQLLKTTEDLNASITIYADLINNINKCEQYLSTKQMIINMI